MSNSPGSGTKRNKSELRQGNNNSSSCSERSSDDSSNSVRTRARKRKRCETLTSSDKEMDSEFEECDLEDAMAIEKNLRIIARNNSFSQDEMRRLLRKFIKNEHLLALVTLKAEDEMAREKLAAEKLSIIVTDNPAIPKLTRARARELNRTPIIGLPSLTDANSPEIAALIKDDLHSDEDDEEYTFQEEDFISDDDQNITASDMDSNPCTPCTQLTQTEESPVKLSEDGCFKVPCDKQEDLRIAARTRSKYCLEQTTIEDLQSEFIPPDLETIDINDTAELVANDEDWMEFLNDFSKPLNSNFLVDDDDPVNDPEYIADPAENIPVDSEELRDANISRKELTDLVAELFEGLMNEGVSLESIELETPQKFINNSAINNKSESPSTPLTTVVKTGSQERDAVTRQINFDNQPVESKNIETDVNYCVSDATISSTNIHQNECSLFLPNVMSTPSCNPHVLDTKTIPIATVPHHHESQQLVTVPEEVIKSQPELIAVPVTGQPNCYQLAKVVSKADLIETTQELADPTDTRYTVPYDTNYTWRYISVKKHLYSEYMDKFQNLKNVNKSPLPAAEWSSDATGFTQHQHDLLQQQLRIHVQLLTQHFLQTYSHPDLWKWAEEPCKMLYELKERSETDASFKAWNLDAAVDIVTQWKEDCAVDNEENREMMKFLNNEVIRTNRNTRQVARFAPRIMDRMLNSTVFMYPEYLPRIPFTLKQKDKKFELFAPAESHLLALGLEKHMKNGSKKNNKPVSLRRASERISKDIIFGKTPRRIWDRIKALRTANYYNPVKYFFEHGVPPPVECPLHTFSVNVVLPPKERFSDLPMVWQEYLMKKQGKTRQQSATTSPVVATDKARTLYLEFVREAVGDDIDLPDPFSEAEVSAQLETNYISEAAVNNTELATVAGTPKKRRNQRASRSKNQSVTLNVNYVFGADATSNLLNCSNSSNINNISQPLAIHDKNTANTDTPIIFPLINSQLTPINAAVVHQPIVNYNYDVDSSSWLPLVEPLDSSLQVVNDSKQLKITDFYVLKQVDHSSHWEDVETDEESNRKKKDRKYNNRSLAKKRQRLRSAFKISRHQRSIILKHRRARNRLKKRLFHYAVLLTNYRSHLKAQIQKFQHKPLVQYFFKQFKALDLYTELLIDLKMNCKSPVANTNGTVAGGVGGGGGAGGLPTALAPTSPQGSSGLGKRARNNAAAQNQDEEVSSVRSKKANRQEENCRNMLLPDNAEESNRKDAIYAFNFYEKVEDMFKASSRPEDYKRFNYILKNFDPKHDKVSELYYKLERLFLPEYPELAEIFLTFLLPSEAAEIGKFFDHFMATNMNTFINKLNIYFHKQPAQIRKVYNCLSELVEENDVTMKTIEAKILPLLKGNEFLIDWFMQLFPTVSPPERLLSTLEHVNLKEAQNNQNGEYLETLLDVLDSPAQEQQQPQPCQLRYINGQIFYGSKIMLPAKLSFMAQKYADEKQSAESQIDTSEALSNNNKSSSSCIHSIREYGEKRLMSSSTTDCNGSDDNEKSDDEHSKALVIDSTVEDESCSSATFEVCDNATLHAHAVRLNPHYYGTTSSSSYYGTNSSGNPLTSTQNAGPNSGTNTKRGSLNFADDTIKLSPRKQAGGSSANANSTLSNGKATSNAGGSGAGTSFAHNVNNQPNATVGGGGTSVTTTCTTPSSTSHTHSQREKRKSPIKKSTTTVTMATNVTSSSSSPSKSSPTSTTNRVRMFNMQPMVVIHEQNSAIACAKKLKSLVECSSESDTDAKAGITIVAKAKYPRTTSTAATVSPAAIPTPQHHAFKIENTDDVEFIPKNTQVSLTLSSENQNRNIKTPTNSIVDQTLPSSSNIVSSTHDLTISEGDNKLNMIDTSATSTTKEEGRKASSRSAAAVATSSTTNIKDSLVSSPSPAWTRDEDKVILIEMKLGSNNREDLFKRIKTKLTNRNIHEITERHQFLLDFLSKLQKT